MGRADMAVWLPIPEYEGLYEVSERGRVRSVDRVVNWGRHGETRYRQRELELFSSKNGYSCVKLAKKGVTKTEYVHELVMRTFIGARPELTEKCEIRHLDSDKTNNYLSNLLYGTARENSADYQKHRKLKGLK